MAETTKVAQEVAVTLELMLGGGYRAADRRHGVQATGRTDSDALRRLHTWLEQRGLADQATLYQVRRFGRPGSTRDESTYNLRAADIVQGVAARNRPDRQ